MSSSKSTNSTTPTTRDRILSVTADLLSRADQNVLMADIANAAGLSRQAVYLHFKTRAELLIATARFIDEQENIRERLRPSREAVTGRDRLLAYIAFWGEFLPRIEGVAQAVVRQQHEDEAIELAWRDRMSAMREGCEMAVQALADDSQLDPGWTVQTGTDALTAILSFQSWQHLTRECGWSENEYITRLQAQALRTLCTK